MIHLHTRSCYSLLESSLTIPQIVQAAKNSNQKACALTDRNAMFGTMEFIHACQKEDLQPIIGLEITIRRLERLHPILLYAKDREGLENLFALSTQMMTREEAVLEIEELSAYSSHCIVMNAGGDEVLESLCHDSDLDEIVSFLSDLQKQTDTLYVSISFNDSPRYRKSNQMLKLAAQGLGMETIALSRIDYLMPKDVETVRLMAAIATQKSFHDRQLPVREGRYWRSQKEMEELYSPEDLKMTDQLVEQIGSYEGKKAQLPVFPNKAGAPSNDYLRSLCQLGLKKRMHGKIPETYASRLEYELQMIISMGFADYFLIVWDFIREARSRCVLVGPGRGSAAGSLVSWVLGISHVDPIAAGLLFERFLNPERISMPDIDTDFPDDRRDEVIEYVQSLYGKGHVAHIVTFSRMKARMALRDVGRALEIAPRKIDRLCALLPAGPNASLKQAWKENRQFRLYIEEDPQMEKLYALSCSIEGLPRHASVHAGGIVLSQKSIVSYAPMTAVASANLPAVQFSMEHLEELGLIKFDFLALRNLTTLQAMNDKIALRFGKPLDLLRLPLNDPGTYQLLSSGNTLGVFQLDSQGIRNLLRQFRPCCFEDIAAVLALYRPGPMKNINLYLDARFHVSKRVSLHPLLDPVLAETGGIFLYQEQIMEAARLIGGFSLAQADSLRKAMSKKNREIMESWKEQFIQGATQKKIEQKKAEEIFNVMEQFADYGFNKSHSYAYGMLVYQMAYIKAKYPLIFFASALDACIGSSEKTAQFLEECRYFSIPIHPVSINHSTRQYSEENRALRMPFGAIKGFPKTIAQAVIEERENNGPYKDAAVTIVRLLKAGVQEKQVLTLIQAGALDELGVERESLEEIFPRLVPLRDLLAWNEEKKSHEFAGISPPVYPNVPISRLKRLENEKNCYGFFMSRHPAQLLRQYNSRISSTADVLTRTGRIQVSGLVISLHEHRTKKGQLMAFVTLQDDSGKIDLALMPWIYETWKPALKTGQFLWVSGDKNRPESILVKDLQEIDINTLQPVPRPKIREGWQDL